MIFNVEKIRKDFPILKTEVYGKPLVYLDSGATAQKPSCVTETIAYLHNNLNANVHRGVHYMAEEATAMYEDSRRAVAEFIGAPAAENIIFTAGATASLNLVAYSWGDKNLKSGDNIIISEMEHHSNIVPWQIIAERRKVQIRVLPFDDEGNLLISHLADLMDGRTKLLAITQASNTLGTRPDLQAAIYLAHRNGTIVVVDGCQGAVHEKVDVKAMDCDFYAFSAHKLYGPTGVGVLYGKQDLLDAMPPFMCGGDMVDRVTFAKTTYAPVPLKFEAGTANYIGAIALGEAIKYLQQFDWKDVVKYEQEVLRYATERLSAIDGLRIYGTMPDKAPIISFNVEGVHHYDMGMILDKMGIAIRTGQHCAEPVMTHFGITGMCRASLGIYNTKHEIDALAFGIEKAARMLR